MGKREESTHPPKAQQKLRPVPPSRHRPKAGPTHVYIKQSRLHKTKKHGPGPKRPIICLSMTVGDVLLFPSGLDTHALACLHTLPRKLMRPVRLLAYSLQHIHIVRSALTAYAFSAFACLAPSRPHTWVGFDTRSFFPLVWQRFFSTPNLRKVF